MAGLGMLLFWLLYWRLAFDYTTKVKLVGVNGTDYNTEVAARLFGHLSNLLSALLLLPVSRTGLWVDIFAVPYDRAIK